MSERGSFCTEYIYCKECFQAIKKLFLREDYQCKYFKAVVIPSYEPQIIDELPIIAGKVGGGYSGEEIFVFEEMRYKIQIKLCHPLVIAVIPDSTEKRKFIEFKPEEEYPEG